MQTFLFADLAGFTAMTEAHGDEEAADVAGQFCRDVRQLLPGQDAEVVKTIGDAVMVRVGDPSSAIRLGLRIVSELGRRHGSLAIRVGMHTGDAVEREGDWFGASVNLAARVSAQAAGGEVLLTDATRIAAGDHVGYELSGRGRMAMKNVSEPVVVFAAHPAGPETSEGVSIDPVCRMTVDPAATAGSLRHLGVAYSFCSLKCARAFAEDPDRYVTR